MYINEISKSKVSDLKAQKIIISWTLKHVSAIIEHPVLFGLNYLNTEQFDLFIATLLQNRWLTEKGKLH